MEEMNHADNSAPQSPVPPARPLGAPFSFPTGKKELAFAAAILICGLLMTNFVLFGGFQLGFALTAVGSIVCSFVYLRCSGCKPGWYAMCLTGLSLIITAGFGRSSDGFVKFVMILFLLAAVNLGLCLTAGQNRRDPGLAASLLDAPRALFVMGVSKLDPAFRGLRGAFRFSGTAGKTTGAVLLGLVIAVPVLAIVIPLLINADAAFDSLMKLLPDYDFTELIVTLLFGSLLSVLLYVRGVALRHNPREADVTGSIRRKLSRLTVNTVLGAVCVVYVVYLFSQIGYFAGGFAGLLPEGYTVAEYARRGFFEMAVLCGVNLLLIALAVGLVEKEAQAPLSTRLLCLFIGLFSLFLTAAASAKMFLYIGSFGLTRLRVLTETIMLWLGLTTALVMVRLFVPGFKYMQAVMLSAMVIGAALLWTDVDTMVAEYNVSAYQSGTLEQIDMEHLSSLSNGAVPAIARLLEDEDPVVAAEAKTILEDRFISWEDFRSWNYTDYAARTLLRELKEKGVLEKTP